MNIDDALDLINQMATAGATVTPNQGVYQVGSKQWINGKADFDAANKVALDAVAQRAVAMVKQYLSTPGPPNGPSSGPGDAPHQRTKTLFNSIHWRVGKESRFFPSSKPIQGQRTQSKAAQEYQWYQKIQSSAYQNNSIITPYPRKTRGSSLVRVIEVDPQAADNSDRKRLEYYSYYLQTGWWSRPNDQHKDKGTGLPSTKGHARSKANKGQKRPGPRWNPPRPYLVRLAYPQTAAQLQTIYQNVLRSKLPPALKYLADKATLKVTYHRSLRVPFTSENLGIL